MIESKKKEMDGHKNSQVKQLIRTQSSLLRSSSTIRSSIQSLSSFTEDDANAAQADVHDVEEEEEDNNQKIKKPNRSCSTPRTGSTRFVSDAIVLISLACFTFFSLFFFSFFFFYMRKEETPTSENFLLALIFIAITLFFANKNKNLIHKTLPLIKNRFGFSKPNTKQVQWFIGNSSNEEITKRAQQAAEAKKVVREGVEFYSNGDYYEGEFYSGKSNGSGVYNYFVEGRYEGDWIDGSYDGYGIESWARGSKYRGQYKQGLRHGYGVYRFYTGDCYAGEWFNGQSHGVGVQTCSDNSSYVGEFKFGVKHGLGCYHFRNGDRYAGEYFNDKIHGFGVYHFANSHCYEGSWHEGRKQGYGMYTFRNGEARCGEWDSGKLNHPQHPLTGSVLRAVQAARKTAENVVSLRRVDEQLNRAVAGANRAATAARVAAVKAVQNKMSGKFSDADVV